jgi:hypothetical protein
MSQMQRRLLTVLTERDPLSFALPRFGKAQRQSAG